MAKKLQLHRRNTKERIGGSGVTYNQGNGESPQSHKGHMKKLVSKFIKKVRRTSLWGLWKPFVREGHHSCCEETTKQEEKKSC